MIKKKEKKLARWQTIAEAAAKQSGRGKIPEIHTVSCPFPRRFPHAEELDTVLIPYELSDNMAESVEVMKKKRQEAEVSASLSGRKAALNEVKWEAAMEAGAAPVSLERRILRTETAGMTALSVLMFLIEGKE